MYIYIYICILIFTFTGWSFIGKNLIKIIAIKELLKQIRTNKAPIIGNKQCVKQSHTNKAPTNEGKSPYELSLQFSVFSMFSVWIVWILVQIPKITELTWKSRVRIENGHMNNWGHILYQKYFKVKTSG